MSDTPTTPIPRAAPRKIPQPAPRDIPKASQAAGVLGLGMEAVQKTFTSKPITRGSRGDIVLIYGAGGIGKTTLACHAPGPVAVIDFDSSLPLLSKNLESMGVSGNVRSIDDVLTWNDLRQALRSNHLKGDFKTIVIDPLTRAERLCIEIIVANVKHEKGHIVRAIEDYGYGKGYGHLFNEWCCLLADVDAIAARGQNVVLVCHDCNAKAVNPRGDDFRRYEPRLHGGDDGKNSVRLVTKERVDHVVCIAYDIDVNSDGKARGSGTATIYCKERPWVMAKSRTMSEEMPMDIALTEFWPTLLGDKQ